jgi:acetyl esterase/lipase
MDAVYPPGKTTTGAAAPLVIPRLWSMNKVEPVPTEWLTFAEHDGSPLHLRFYHSERACAPCVIVIHTGGWYNGTPDEFIEFNSALAHRGYAVAAIEHRFAPQWTWPAQREDALDALRFLRARADQLGIDASRFVLFGRSAGAQIAEATAYAAHDPSIRGVIAFYGPADMFLAYRYARSNDILNSLKLVRDFMGGSPEEQPDRFVSASSIRLASKESPPTLLLHGRRDELVWHLQSERLAFQLQDQGARVAFLSLDWATHAFDYSLNGPGGQISLWAVTRFLDSVTATH